MGYGMFKGRSATKQAAVPVLLYYILNLSVHPELHNIFPVKE